MRKIHTPTPFMYMRKNFKSRFFKITKTIIFIRNKLQKYEQKFPGRKGSNDLSPKNIQSRVKNSERV